MISGPPARQPRGTAIHKQVRFADDVIHEDSSSRDLVSPPPKPAQSLLERLCEDVAGLPFSLQEIITPAQFQTMEAVEDCLERLRAAVTLCEMRQGRTPGAEHGGACSGPLESNEESPRSPGETPEVGTKKIVLRRPSREMGPETAVEKGPAKIVLHMDTDKGNSRVEEVSPEEATPEMVSPKKATPPKANLGKSPRNTITASKIYPRKLTP